MILKLRRMLRNPAPVHRWFTPLFVGFQPSQVQDFALPSTVFFFGGHSKTRGSLWFFIFDEYHPFLSGHHGWEVRPGGNGLFPDCKPKDYSSQMRLWYWVYHISVVGCIDISIYIYIYTAYYPIISPINIYISIIYAHILQYSNMAGWEIWERTSCFWLGKSSMGYVPGLIQREMRLAKQPPCLFFLPLKPTCLDNVSH